MRFWRRWGVIAIATIAAPACNVTSMQGASDPFRIDAGIAADDPKAALVGRDALADGGTAADAAAAMGLVMSVTMPARAGLAGGGICLVHDPAKPGVRVLDFLPAGSGTAAALPGTPRGLYALQAAHGKLRWSRAVAPAEALARSDRAVSRAAALDFADFEPVLAADPEAARIFMATGRSPDEGQPVAQPALASVLAALRDKGPGVFHSGPLAERIAQAGGYGLAALDGARPAWTEPSTLTKGNTVLSVPAGAEGKRALEAWQVGTGAAADRAVRVVDALRPSAPASPPPTAGFAVLDRDGQAVTCAFTMGGPFGTGRMVPGTGLFLAAPSGHAGIGGPVLAVNPNTAQALFAASGSTGLPEEGAAGAAAGLVTTAVAVLDRGMPTGEAVGGLRIAPAMGDEVLVERTAPATIEASLQRPVRVVPTIGRTNLVACQVRSEDGGRNCRAETDPRGFGLALTGY